MQAWETQDQTLTWPVAAPLERCAELLGVELAALSAAAAQVEPYLRVDGTKIWSLMQLERQTQTAEELITERRNQGQHVD